LWGHESHFIWKTWKLTEWRSFEIKYWFFRSFFSLLKKKLFWKIYGSFRPLKLSILRRKKFKVNRMIEAVHFPIWKIWKNAFKVSFYDNFLVKCNILSFTFVTYILQFHKWISLSVWKTNLLHLSAFSFFFSLDFRLQGFVQQIINLL